MTERIPALCNRLILTAAMAGAILPMAANAETPTAVGKPYVAAERIIFNWHNFLSGCSTWDAEDWHGWIRRAHNDGYNAIMVHAYANNPMGAFSFNGRERQVGCLTTSADGRDWSTMHVNDVRRLVGGQVFGSSVFGSRAALVPDAERVRAARSLMRQVFADAALRKMGVYFAVDFDADTVNPPMMLPESARFRLGKKVWVPNPDTPEGYAYYKSAVDCWIDAYPQITTLAVWFRESMWKLDEKSVPETWRREYASAVDGNPSLAKHPHAFGIFAYSKIVRAVMRALKERGASAKVAAGSWRFNMMPAVDAFLPEGVALIYLDYNILHGKPDLKNPDVRAKMAEMSARRPVIPVIWAQHDDGHYIGRAYEPYDNLAELLAEGKAAGFGVIHWMTRPLDFFLFASARQVVPGAKKETLREMCEVFAAERLKEPKLGGYLADWAVHAPIFGRDTTDYFIDRKLGGKKDAVIAGCRARLRMLEGIDGPDAAYFRTLEKFCIAFYEAQAMYEKSAAAFRRGDFAAAGAAISAARPEAAIELYASLASGKLTKGEKGVLVSLNTKWLVYFHQMRQSLGIEPMRVKFGVTRHEPLAQLPGEFTYYIDAEKRVWQTFGTKETGAERVFSANGAPDEIARDGVASGKGFSVSVGPIGKAIDGLGVLRPGEYTLRVLAYSSDPSTESRSVFKVVAGDSAVGVVYSSKVPGGAHRLAEVEIPVALKKAGRLDVSFVPVKGEIAVSGLILERIRSPQKR